MGRYLITIDTETTGFDHETNSLVEIAAVGEDKHQRHSLIRPTTPISFGAMATHHITPAMVEDAPDFAEAISVVELDPTDIQKMEADGIPPILVMHNAEFDRAFLPPHLQELSFICTWRCAVALFPDAESHSNGALWYELGLDHEMPEEAGSMPHRALFDAIMTRDLVEYMLDYVKETNPNVGNPIDHLIWLTTQPILLKKCRFGKHRDKLWSEIPRDYLQWCLRQDFDEDVKFTCRFWMEN